MTCSLQEIEEKRRQALERRNARMQTQLQAAPKPQPKFPNQSNFTPKTPSTSKPLQTSNSGPELNRSSSLNGQGTLRNFLNKNHENQDLKRKINSYPPSEPPSKLIKQINNQSISIVNNKMSPTKVSPIDPNKFFNKEQIKGTVSMVTLTRFEVDIRYCQPFIEYCKTFKTRMYDQQRKLWTFDITEYNDFIKGLKDRVPMVQIAQLPQYVYRVFRDNADQKPEQVEPDLSRIDPKLMETVMPFQREGICFGIKRNGRCMIADDMGLGKTIQALGIAHYYKSDWPLLIVAPSSLTHQWFQSIMEFLPSVLVHEIVIYARGQYLNDNKITIISYDLLMKNVDYISGKRFGTIILDESHTLKTLSAKKTEAVKRIVDKSNHIILLSGTPALSRPIELYSQITLIMPNFLTLHNYGMRYCNAEQSKFGWNYKGSSNAAELQLLLKSTCLIRRLKVDVLSQLPSKFRQIIMLDPSLIDDGTEEMKEAYKKCSQNKGNSIHTMIVQCFNESSSQRIKAVCNYLDGVLEKENKFIVFAHHKCILDAITELLVRKSVKFIRIDGNTRSEDRKALVDRFQERDNIRVAVLSITAANAGITLTAANLCIFAELYWNPGILCQAEDRIHRIGQNQSVVIRYLIAEKTIDDHLWPLLRTKLNFLTKAGLNQDFSLDNADVSKQIISGNPTSKQGKLDGFVTVTSSPNSKDEENQADVFNASTDVSDLMLDEDDEDLANIDLDMYQ